MGSWLGLGLGLGSEAAPLLVVAGCEGISLLMSGLLCSSWLGSGLGLGPGPGLGLGLGLGLGAGAGKGLGQRLGLGVRLGLGLGLGLGLTESVVCLVVYYLLLTTYYSLLTTGLLTNRERGVLGRLVQVGLGLGAARLEIELGRGG